MKSYTDIEQSKKLAEILPVESADMCWTPFDEEWDAYLGAPNPDAIKKEIPCWSLAALLEQLPYEICDDEGNSAFLSIDRENYQLVYNPSYYGDFDNIETDVYEDFVDACCEMLLKLKENNLL